MKRRRGPIIPGNTEDRTGAAGILRRARTQINVRFAMLKVDVITAFDRLPVYQYNDAAGVLYGMTPEQMQLLSGELQAALDAWIARGNEAATRFWWSPFVAEAAQAGAAQSVLNLSGLSAAYEASRNLQMVLFSEPFRNRVGIAQIKSYDHWTGQSAAIKSDLSQIIGSAIADGKSPASVRTLIRDRLDVSKAKAAQFAQTDITDTLRQARWAESEQASEEFGLNIGLLWTSALKRSTRSWHASRNGKVYTAEQVRKFYGENGNRYHCYCAQTECLLDEGDQPILTDALKATMAKERVGWQKAHGKAAP